MTKALKITTIVAASLVSLGLILGVVGFVLGGIPLKDLRIHTAENSGWQLDVGDKRGPASIFGMGSATDRQTDSGQETLPPFTSIQVDVDFMGLSLVPSETNTYEIQYICYNDAKRPSWKVENETLTLEANLHERERSGINSGKYWEVIVFYPKDAVFEKTEIDCDAGSITVDALNSRSLDVNLDAGEIRFDNSEFGKAKISADAGSVRLHGGRADSMEINVDAGELETKAFDTGALKAEADMGSIRLDGRLEGESDLAVTMGEIVINTGLTREEYRLNLKTTMGDKELVNGSEQADDSGAKNSISASSDMGSIKITFSNK